MLVGEPYWRREPPDQATLEACYGTGKEDWLPLPEGTPTFTLREGGTPLIDSPWLSELTGAQVWIKVTGLGCLWAAAVLTLVTGWDYLRVGLKHMD